MLVKLELYYGMAKTGNFLCLSTVLRKVQGYRAGL